MQFEFDRYELMVLDNAVDAQLQEAELWMQEKKKQGDITLIAMQLIEERIQRLETMHEKLSKFIAEIEQAEAQPINLSSQRTKRAMHDLATSSDVLTGDLSNGLEPLTESEDN